jgi:hypothetical protein
VTGAVDQLAMDVVAMDGLSVLGTVGFFVPAALLVALVVGAVVRDRRLSAREEAAAGGEDVDLVPGRGADHSPRAD